jgi:hypothetical protein
MPEQNPAQERFGEQGVGESSIFTPCSDFILMSNRLLAFHSIFTSRVPAAASIDAFLAFPQC